MGININNLTPAYAIHPGEILHDELKARSLTVKTFSSKNKLDYTLLKNIISQKRNINAEIAEMLEHSLNIPTDIWLNLQLQYENVLEIQKKTNAKIEAENTVWEIIKNNFPIKYLKKYFNFTNNVSDNIAIVFNLFEVKNLDDLFTKSQEKYTLGTCRKSQKLKTNSNYLATWMCIAEQQVKNINIQTFKIEDKDLLINEILQNISDTVDVNLIFSILNRYGIKTNKLIDKPEHCNLDAYSFWSVDNPAITFTFKYKRIDNFVFNLFHELGHIYLHLSKNHDSKFCNFNIKDNNIIDPKENEADEFANSILFNNAEYIAFEKRGLFTRQAIKDIANVLRLPEAIICGKLNHLGFLPYSAIHSFYNDIIL